jgi:hypothetical protein
MVPIFEKIGNDRSKIREVYYGPGWPLKKRMFGDIINAKDRFLNMMESEQCLMLRLDEYKLRIDNIDE